MLEKGKWVGPIVDQHMHLDRTNLFLDAVADFSSSGGTGIMLVHKLIFTHLPIDLEGYREAYSHNIHSRRGSYRIRIRSWSCPRPSSCSMGEADPELGIEASSELHLEAVSLALEYRIQVMHIVLVRSGDHITQSEKKFGKEQ